MSNVEATKAARPRYAGIHIYLSLSVRVCVCVCVCMCVCVCVHVRGLVWGLQKKKKYPRSESEVCIRVLVCYVCMCMYACMHV